MKRLFLFLIACVTGWWGYRKLRSHPKTAGKVAELEHHSQLVADKASDLARSAREQATSRAADIADTAATGAQDAIDTAAGKAHEALDAATKKARQAISPAKKKIAELRTGGSVSATTEPGAEHPVG